MKLEEARQESLRQQHYSRGWNQAVLDITEGRILIASELKMDEHYTEGYEAGQEHIILKRAQLREDFDAAPVV